MLKRATFSVTDHSNLGCTRCHVPFTTVEHAFADREAAMDWIDANQLGWRNLTPDQRSFLRGRRYNLAGQRILGGRRRRAQGPLGT